VFVLASPLRLPKLAAWDAHTLTVLTGGRFEFGVGTGRPQVVQEAADISGRPLTTASERLQLAEQSIDELRTLDADLHTPVLVAAGGSKARALAAAKADIVTFATGPLVSRDSVAAMAAEVRQQAGDRAGQIEFMMPVFVVGDEVPPAMARFLQTDIATMIEHDSLQLLRGTPRQMADELERRRDALGVSYVSVNAAYCDAFAPVVDLLAGR
jgi:alkanesulfonate monooxygenase SsuD/methylene tetrahydromethanopterin reductase-like flavin-dependent oxidoreductase (luciferase family)